MSKFPLNPVNACWSFLAIQFLVLICVLFSFFGLALVLEFPLNKHKLPTLGRSENGQVRLVRLSLRGNPLVDWGRHEPRAPCATQREPLFKQT